MLFAGPPISRGNDFTNKPKRAIKKLVSGPVFCYNKTEMKNQNKDNIRGYKVLGAGNKKQAVFWTGFCLSFVIVGVCLIVFTLTNAYSIESIIAGIMLSAGGTLFFFYGAFPEIKILVKTKSVSGNGSIGIAKIFNYSCKSRTATDDRNVFGWIYYTVSFKYSLTVAGRKRMFCYKRNFSEKPELFEGKTIRILYNKKFAVVLEN